MAPPDRKILLPKLAAEAPGEIDQVLPATTKRKALPPRRRNAPVAYQRLLGIEPQHADIFQDPGLSNLLHDSVSSLAVNIVVQPREVLGRTSFGADNSIFIDPCQISHRTSVPISNQFAAEAIALYLNTNQPWWAYFDTDLFLYELANAETNFCSSILVNALLAWATVSLRNCQVYVHQTVITKLASQQSYAHYEPMATTLPTKFLDEALWIYDDEKSVDCLTTVAATSLMNMTFTTLGKDKAGRRLQEDNARMAQRM
ncbi:hypothetical protein FVEG_15285 [Fusarium verticillioides 7600]|uniref:Transcription factor domain-containing protein n=1 Tax=Gibberella moniliformis (strain M3125 / FGSC 7600) TaxID=334819 RepID=W7LQD6_GIBM7|nr:hypothetical protein FVEG_15285 [Fusarium verticillioides 7600]EWG41373.1 hypothetical protein FVEG_15285 [Fusarium verticillioides 7600]